MRRSWGRMLLLCRPLWNGPGIHGLEARQQEREAQRGWFESWFSQSPWLTTLLSALVGPILFLLLLLTIGPCIFNKLIAFVQDRIRQIKLMVIRQQYEALHSDDLHKL